MLVLLEFRSFHLALTTEFRTEDRYILSMQHNGFDGIAYVENKMCATGVVRSIRVNRHFKLLLEWLNGRVQAVRVRFRQRCRDLRHQQ
jgi:hypothetical protein